MTQSNSCSIQLREKVLAVAELEGFSEQVARERADTVDHATLHQLLVSL